MRRPDALESERVLFTLLAERYERGSVMLSEQLAVQQVGTDLQRRHDDGGAAIDRLVHHSVILELNVPSYRLENAKNPRQKSRPNKADTKPK